MRITIFVTQSMRGTFENIMIPSCKEQKADFLSRHKDVSLTIAAQNAAPLVLDDGDSDFIKIPVGVSAQKVASIIKETEPDLVISATAHCAPYDWGGLFDAVVGDVLRGEGVKVLTPIIEFSAAAISKRDTHNILKGLAEMPRYLYANRAMLLSSSGETDVVTNVYREYLLSELGKMRYPVVIKDDIGVSSYHIEVVKTFGEAKTYILSKRCKCNKIIEEYVTGDQFALEAYCKDGRCVFGPLVSLSLNNYGVTSPRFNTKRVVTHEDIDALHDIIKNIVKKFSLSGVIQFDVVYSKDGREEGGGKVHYRVEDEKVCFNGASGYCESGEKVAMDKQCAGHWVIIEVNARPGGVTLLSAAAMRLNVFDLLTVNIFKPALSYRTVIEEKVDFNSDISEVARDAVFVYRCKNKEATQLRERG